MIRDRMSRGLRLIGVILALGQMGAAPALGPQWPTYNNRLEGQRFSPLKQITTETADQLGEVCRLQIDGPTSFSAGLIVVDGVIYTNTGHQTVAIDAATCALRWKHEWVSEDDEIVPSNRGVAVLDGRVFRGTGDGRLIALDAATGKLLWKNVIGAPRLGEFASAAPLAWQGVVFMGVAGSDRAVRGRVMAFDAATGRELWRFNTIPMGKETGASSWKHPETAKTGGGGVWGAMTLDVTTGELFVPTGNPWPDIARHYRPGENLFSNSIVVLDARTGALKWWHQAAPDDGHDMDLSGAPVLYRDAQIRDIMAFGGKDGYVRAVDRDTHKLLFKTPITTLENEGVFATPEGVHICPGFGGGIQWNGPAYVPAEKLLITGVVDWCMTIKSAPMAYKSPDVSYGGTVKPDPDAKGWIVALDSGTGQVRWRHHTDKPVISGITPTAGGVTFAGDMGGNFMVLDTKTGAVLKTIPTGGAMAGGLVTYEVGGRQYVAFASGNVSRSTFGALGVPTVVIMALGGQGQAAPVADAGPTPVHAGDVDHGRAIYGQVCVACHGANGEVITGHSLAGLSARRDLASTLAFLRNPTPPMPRLYPGALKEQDLADVAAYLQKGVGS